MKKLADISTFEGLQPKFAQVQSDMAVFNISDIQILDLIKTGGNHGSVENGIWDAADAFMDDLLAEHPDLTVDEYESLIGQKADELNKKIRKSERLNDRFYSALDTWGEERWRENGDPEDDTFLAWGGTDGICDAFAEFAMWILEDRLAGKDTTYENVIARKMGFA